MKEYNEHSRRIIGRTPSITDKTNEKEIFSRMYPLKDFKLDKPVFLVGDGLSIFRKKKQFSDKYTNNLAERKFIQ